jgi:ethanolamine ammonia-lyase large subunit
MYLELSDDERIAIEVILGYFSSHPSFTTELITNEEDMATAIGVLTILRDRLGKIEDLENGELEEILLQDCTTSGRPH